MAKFSARPKDDPRAQGRTIIEQAREIRERARATREQAKLMRELAERILRERAADPRHGSEAPKQEP